MSCIEPFAVMILFFISLSHMPRFTKSRSKCLFTIMNSPLNTRRVYMFEVYGSKHSLLPNICEVDAVGIGATNNEFLTPCSITSALNDSQSQRSVGCTPH